MLWYVSSLLMCLMKTLCFSVYCFSEVEQTAPVEETAETAQQQGTTEGEPLKKYSLAKIYIYFF